MALTDYYYVEGTAATTMPTWTTTTWASYSMNADGNYRIEQAEPADLRMTMFMEDILRGGNKTKKDRTLLSDDAPDMDV